MYMMGFKQTLIVSSKFNPVAWCEIRLWAEIIKSSEETLAMHAHFHCWIQGRRNRATLAQPQGLLQFSKS